MNVTKAALIVSGLMMTVFALPASAEISALEMRQNCRGIEILDSDRVRLNRESPGAGICWGAFSTLHQLSLGVGDDNASVFLPGVCSIRGGHGQRAIVLIEVFNHYVDEHSWDGGEQFAVVAWNAFQAAWPCAAAAK